MKSSFSVCLLLAAASVDARIYYQLSDETVFANQF